MECVPCDDEDFACQVWDLVLRKLFGEERRHGRCVRRRGIRRGSKRVSWQT